jgi:hypothetical protein
MEFVIIAIAVFFNFAVIKYKIEKKRYADVTLDVTVLTILSFLFAGSFGGLVVATIASALMSIYLYFWPPKLPNFW